MAQKPKRNSESLRNPAYLDIKDIKEIGKKIWIQTRDEVLIPLRSASSFILLVILAIIMGILIMIQRVISKLFSMRMNVTILLLFMYCRAYCLSNSLTIPRESIQNNFGYSKVGYTKKIRSYLRTSEVYDTEAIMSNLKSANIALSHYWEECSKMKKDESNFVYFNQHFNASQIAYECAARNMDLPQVITSQLEEELLEIQKQNKLEKVLLGARYDPTRNRMVWEKNTIEIGEWVTISEKSKNKRASKENSNEFPGVLRNGNIVAFRLWLIANTKRLTILEIDKGSSEEVPLVCMRRQWDEPQLTEGATFQRCHTKFDIFQARSRTIEAKVEAILNSLKIGDKSAGPDTIYVPIGAGNYETFAEIKQEESSLKPIELTGMLATSIPKMKNMFPAIVEDLEEVINITTLQTDARLRTIEYAHYEMFFAVEKEPAFQGKGREYLEPQESYLSNTYNLLYLEVSKYENIFYSILKGNYVTTPKIYKDLETYVNFGQQLKVSPTAKSAAVLPGRTPYQFVVYAQFPVTTRDLPIYEVISVPVKVAFEDLVVPITSTKYVVLAEDKLSFYRMSAAELANCKNSICEIVSPKEKLQDDLCGPAQLTRAIAPDCQYRLHREAVFMKATPAALYYSIQSSVEYRLSCAHATDLGPDTRGTLEGTGILFIAAQCIIEFPGLGKEYSFPDSDLLGFPPFSKIPSKSIDIPRRQVIYEKAEEFEQSFKHYVDEMSWFFMIICAGYISSVFVISIGISAYMHHREKQWVTQLQEQGSGILQQLTRQQEINRNRVLGTTGEGNSQNTPSTTLANILGQKQTFKYPNVAKSTETSIRNVYSKVPGEVSNSSSDSSAGTDLKRFTTFTRIVNKEKESIKGAKGDSPVAVVQPLISLPASDADSSTVDEVDVQTEGNRPVSGISAVMPESMPLWEEPGHSSR